MPLTEHKTILSSVRPQRVAVFIDKSDPDWQNTCLRIIEFYCTLWGGKYNIMIPTDGATISETFWKILEAFDPDYLYVYSKSPLDLKLGRPDEYEALLDRECEKFLDENPGADRDDIRASMDEQLERVFYQDNLSISDNLQKELKARLAPFYFENWIVQPRGIGARSDAHFPLTSIAKILPNTEHAPEVSAVNVTGISALWYSAVTGRMHEPYVTALEQVSVRTVAAPFENRLWSLFNIVVRGHADGDIALPFDLTLTGIGLYRSLKYRYWEEPKIVVAGETVDDFCLYYCISRLRDGVSWFLPSWLTSTSITSAYRDAPAAQFAQSLYNSLLERNTYRKAIVISLSLLDTDLQRVRQELDSSSKVGRGLLQTEINVGNVPEMIDGLLQFPLVAYERDNTNRDVTKDFVDHKLVGLFETPKPKTFRRIDPSEHRWISELRFHEHQFPRHSALGTWIIRDHRLGTGETRAGANGTAYFCPNVAYFGGDIDTILVKPSLYILDAFEMFDRLAQDAGMTCKVSDKGLYAQETIRKFNGLRAAAEFCRDSKRRELLQTFTSRTKPGKGVQDEGVFLSSDRRRYLNFEAIQKILGSPEETSALIDLLIADGIFLRGFIFKCAYCRNADYFHVDEISQEFVCKRCRKSQTYTRRHWLKPYEPGWFYKLDEIVYQAICNDMIVPVLALDCLRRRAPESFLYTTEIELKARDSDKPLIEMDICCVPAGLLTVGEAKVEERIGVTAGEENRALINYRQTAQNIGARQIVFATMADAWASVTTQKLGEIFGRSGLKTVLLTRSDLLSA